MGLGGTEYGWGAWFNTEKKNVDISMNKLKKIVKRFIKQFLKPKRKYA